MRPWISRRLFKEMVTWEKCLPHVQISSIDSWRKTMRFTCLSVPTCTLLSCYIFSNEFIFFVMYMNLYIYTVSLSNSIICWHHCTRRFMCISSCTDFCWYVNFRQLHFACFLFQFFMWMVECAMSKYRMKPFYSYCSSLRFLYCICLLYIFMVMF